MTTTLITEAQKAVLNAATTGGGKSRASRYAEPTVQPVDAFGVLHPDTTGVDNVEIVVDYDGMPNNDILRFYWNGDLSIPAAVADTKPKRVSVPAALVIAAANKTIYVIYSVIDDNNPDGVPSDIHTLLIDKYTPPVYPPPVITEAVNGVLDVGALTKNATVTVAAWPGIAVGQKIWLSMVSTPPVKLTNWVGFPIVNTGAQSTTISLNKLKTLLDGSTIELHFEVSFDGGLTRVPFPTTTYTIKQVDELTIDSSLMLLNGRLIHGWDPEPTSPPANTHKDRVATGGVLPYTYKSSNEAVAYVTELTGRVFSVGNGSATITITDRNGSITSYPVTVSNVLQMFNTNLTAIYQTCANQAASMGGHILTLDEWREFYLAYTPRHTGIPSDWCWTSTPTELVPGTTWLFGPDNGQSLAQYAGRVAPGFGLTGLLPVQPAQPITITNMYYNTPFAPALRPLPNGGQLPPPASEQIGDSFQITISGSATRNAPFVYCISYGKSPVPISGWLTVMVPASGIFQSQYAALFHPNTPGRPRGRYYLYQQIAGQPVELPWSLIL